MILPAPRARALCRATPAGESRAADASKDEPAHARAQEQLFEDGTPSTTPPPLSSASAALVASSLAKVPPRHITTSGAQLDGLIGLQGNAVHPSADPDVTVGVVLATHRVDVLVVAVCDGLCQ